MREVGEGEGGGAANGIGTGSVGPDVHLEQLPAYEAMDTSAAQSTILQPTPVRPIAARAEAIPPYTPAPNVMDREEAAVPVMQSQSQSREERSSSPAAVASPRAPAPALDELPPGYEESQSQQRDEVVESLGRMGVGE